MIPQPQQTIPIPNFLDAQNEDEHGSLRVGMQVRVPFEPGRSDEQFRDFYLGRIEGFDNVEGTVQVRLYHRDFGEIREDVVTIPRVWARHCCILPDSKVALVDRDAGALVLAACETEWTPGEFCEYYVRLDGKTVRMGENNLIAASHRADPDPFLQLSTYEFQNPTFRPLRDALVESHSELQAATQGIEELVGSRIMLLAHQAEVVATVLSDPECRYLLADEVGLGKTIEACVILKGLRRRHPRLRALILAPAALVNQWYFELDNKFWLRFSLPTRRQLGYIPSGPGLILSHEALAENQELFRRVAAEKWDLLIVDEAHHVSKNPELNKRIVGLSAATPRALLLSATPIQRRATEFLALLKLLDPMRYGKVAEAKFSKIVAAQHELLRIIARLVPDLTPKYFDPDDFCDEMETVLELLHHDAYLAQCVASVQAKREHADQALTPAREAIAYISENYRLERRVIRNRRVNLQLELPTRMVNEKYAYRPTKTEAAALDEVHEYADYLLKQHRHSSLAQEVVRLLFHAAFSSPQALLELLQRRKELLTGRVARAPVDMKQLLVADTPRAESERIKGLLEVLPGHEDEKRLLEWAIGQAGRWRDEMIARLEKLPYRSHIPAGPERFAQVLHALDEYIRAHPEAKIVVFAQWLASLQVLIPFVQKQFGREAVFEFHIGLPEERLQEQATAFQDAERKAILLCDELGGEGRNFQVADLIIHLDLPWTPAKVEQRIGRVDRFGRRGEVVSIIPFAREQIEEDLYALWQDAFELFTRSMSGMEIMLEGIQDELMDSLRQGTRDGLRRLLPKMTKNAQTMREQVEEERFYEEPSINKERRAEFTRISRRYDDGQIVRDPLLKWANQAGLANSYNPVSDIARYFPRDFSQGAMKNAKFNDAPNMEEALMRSRRASNLQIEGTFNRAIAVTREDLVFYAPSSDPWTDAIIRNAIEADRGRCCCIRRESPEIDKASLVFELTYHVQIDPRPLLALGHDPIHLLRGQGYLDTPIHRLWLTQNGKQLSSNDPLVRIIQPGFDRKVDTHLGKRSKDSKSEEPPLAWFKRKVPDDKWRLILEHLVVEANKILHKDFVFMEERADKAQEKFEQAGRGLQAATEWYLAHKLIEDAPASMAAIDTYRQISNALVAGLRKPLVTLESACCWYLRPPVSR